MKSCQVKFLRFIDVSGLDPRNREISPAQIWVSPACVHVIKQIWVSYFLSRALFESTVANSITPWGIELALASQALVAAVPDNNFVASRTCHDRRTRILTIPPASHHGLKRGSVDI